MIGVTCPQNVCLIWQEHKGQTIHACSGAVINRALAEVTALAGEADALPPGPARDRAVPTGVARLALDGTTPIGYVVDKKAHNNRHHLGEKSFRDIIVSDAHPAIITDNQFKRAQRILTRRSEELETAIGQALLDFYTTGHDVIEQAVSTSLTAHQQANGARHQELASIKHQLRENSAPSTATSTPSRKAPSTTKTPTSKPGSPTCGNSPSSYGPTRHAWSSISTSHRPGRLPRILP